MKNVHVLAAALLASHTRGIAIEERGGGPPQTDVEEVALAQYSWAKKC